MQLEHSQQLLTHAVQYALQIEVKVNIAVYDQGANLCAFQRMDNAPLGSIEIAQKKAYSAVMFGASTDNLGQLVKDQQLDGFAQTNGGLILFAGGEPIYQADQLIGGIGISGGSAAQDKAIALAAIKQSGYNRLGADDVA
ncbi:heme-binding protein [Amphritea opalescens]|uniref:Heme-binding protein n=1 Tax=Amphritea opalescens TaxID=2490544 RepID=A0A430KQW4_9GAMM|nr:heme-binding protein [Amphritea opalescens]RTE65734.1 heme-binding protein [Amphritea opalescens]